MGVLRRGEGKDLSAKDEAYLIQSLEKVLDAILSKCSDVLAKDPPAAVSFSLSVARVTVILGDGGWGFDCGSVEGERGH